MRERISSERRPIKVPKEWLSVCEVAAVLGIHSNSVYRALGSGGLRHMRINGRRSGQIRIRRSWLEAWIERNSRENW